MVNVTKVACDVCLRDAPEVEVVHYEASTGRLYASADLCADHSAEIRAFIAAHPKRRKGRKRGAEDIVDL